jgi:hypothetical protein
VRPLVAALLRLAPATEITLFFVPDDYATGREPDVAQRLFPGVHVVRSRDYLAFALGGRVPAAPARADLVQYLGGDLMHAVRVAKRLRGRARSYKFSRPRYKRAFERAYALDERNAGELEATGLAHERVMIVGNLAIDGALGEAAGAFATGGDPPAALPPDGVLFMPGSRRNEVLHVLPLFLQAAVQLARIAPDLPLAFGLSPFTLREEVESALALGGAPTAWGARGRVVALGDGFGLQAADSDLVWPVVRDAMRHAAASRLAVTLPGTKCIELAALGVPAVVCVPLNVPEMAVINGPLQYLDRLPLGKQVKRMVAIGIDRRFPVAAQPNMDAGEMLMPEMRGTLMPGDIARRVAAYANDEAARARSSERLTALYAAHVGAAERMARSLLEESA